ncbi:GtrA family protein [Methanoregula sp.]|jgi:putative flippase GtrA|uniref:GtrA family protein n=1 Tax=Methanoregula sp. TaxID=2052170 RepID=UPI003C2757F4
MRPSGYACGDAGMTSSTTASHRTTILWFFCAGAVSSLVDIGLLWVLVTSLGLWYLPAAAISYCCGILVNYGMNKYITFHDGTTDYVTQFTRFAAISVSCLFVNLCIIWIAVEMYALNYLPAKVIATACAFCWSYYGQSRFTFRGGN